MIAVLSILLPTAAPDDAAAEARRTLESTRATVDFREAPLGEVVGFLRDLTKLNFHLAEADGDARVTLKLREVSAATVLRFALRPHALRAVWRDGVIVIEPRGGETPGKVTRVAVGGGSVVGRGRRSTFCGNCAEALRKLGRGRDATPSLGLTGCRR